MSPSQPSPTISAHDDVPFGRYQPMPEVPDRFAAMDWPFDRATFIDPLNEVRENHDGMRISTLNVSSLKHFLKFLPGPRKWDSR